MLHLILYNLEGFYICTVGFFLPFPAEMDVQSHQNSPNVLDYFLLFGVIVK